MWKLPDIEQIKTVEQPGGPGKFEPSRFGSGSRSFQGGVGSTIWEILKLETQHGRAERLRTRGGMCRILTWAEIGVKVAN